MSLIDGLRTAQFTLQVSRVASSTYSRASIEHKDDVTDATRGEISTLVDQISAQMREIRSTVATSRLAMPAAQAVAAPPQTSDASQKALDKPVALKRTGTISLTAKSMIAFEPLPTNLIGACAKV